MKVPVDVVEATRKGREEVIDDIVMKDQEMAEHLQEKKELQLIHEDAEYVGLLAWRDAYEQAKSALSRFGPRSEEYRSAKDRFRHVVELILRSRSALEAEMEQARQRFGDMPEEPPTLYEILTPAGRLALWMRFHQEPQRILSDEEVEKFEEFFVPKNVSLPEVSGL